MKILVEGEIEQAVVDCKPSKIAVAYIGVDWQTYIPDLGCLESIIVSPTIGSNPWAITDLVKQIGWEKVDFLDELHAKTYVGKNSAVIGSANLTRNGLGSEGLVELCVEVNGEESLKKVNKTFNALKRRAQKQYPTITSKKSRLRELEQKWGEAIANRIFRNENNNTHSFMDFELLGEEHFYVLWYQPTDCEYSEDINAIQSLMTDELHFAANDKPEKNKWVFAWRITDASKPHKSAKAHWMYIHEVFDDGVINEGYEYPKCAIQRNDLEVPNPPFELTDDVVECFKKVVQKEEISKFLIQDNSEVFSLETSKKGVPVLIKKMKECMANKANSTDVVLPPL